MDIEAQDIDEASYVCEWCGVSFTHTPIRIRMNLRYYCSVDCNHAGYFSVYAIVSSFSFLVALSSVLLPYPESLGIFIIGFSIGLLYLLLSFHTWRKRRKIPKGSKTEQHLENDVG
ncbi:MAG: hypothetical protein ACTSQZ_09450 [Candidatus Thorarchaeota archaeon]